MGSGNGCPINAQGSGRGAQMLERGRSHREFEHPRGCAPAVQLGGRLTRSPRWLRRQEALHIESPLAHEHVVHGPGQLVSEHRKRLAKMGSENYFLDAC